MAALDSMLHLLFLAVYHICKSHHEPQSLRSYIPHASSEPMLQSPEKKLRGFGAHSLVPNIADGGFFASPGWTCPSEVGALHGSLKHISGTAKRLGVQKGYPAKLPIGCHKCLFADTELNRPGIDTTTTLSTFLK